MRITNRTFKRLIILAGLVLLCGGLTASSCVPDRHIDIVAGGELTAQFDARGSDNTWSCSDNVDLASEVSSILEDNSFDSDSIHATIESVSYRIIQMDPDTSRTITGTITVARDGGSAQQLFEIPSIRIDDPVYATWVAVPLTAEGTALLNAALATVIANPQAPLNLTFSASGTSAPANVETHFTWEARVKMSIVGKQKITVFQPL